MQNPAHLLLLPFNKMGSIQNDLVFVEGDFNFPGLDWKKRVLKENSQHVNLHLQFSQALDVHSQALDVSIRRGAYKNESANQGIANLGLTL